MSRSAPTAFLVHDGGQLLIATSVAGEWGKRGQSGWYLSTGREAHHLLEELSDAQLDGRRKAHLNLLAEVPLLIIDNLGMRKLPSTAAEDLLEFVMRRYERASTLFTSNRPGKIGPIRPILSTSRSRGSL